MTSLSVDAIEIEEFTHGDSSGPGLQAGQFRYGIDTWEESNGRYALTYNITYNGKKYSGDRKMIARITGNEPVISSNQVGPAGEPWTAGNTYTATATLMGKSCDFNVTIVKSRLTSFTAAPIEVVEGTCGYYVENYNERGISDGRWYYYNPRNMPLVFTVVYGGETFTGSALELSDRYSSSVSIVLANQQSPQSYENQWSTGKTYTVEVSFMGKTAEVKITIKKSPLKSITVENQPVKIVEGTNASSMSIYDPDLDGYTEYYLYSLNNVIFTVDYDGTFKGTAQEIADKYGFEVSTFSDQSYNNRWEKGKTYTAEASFMGKSCEFKIQIVEDKTSWSLKDGVLTISSSKGMQDWASVKAVPWFAQREQIKKVVIEDGITSIGSNAFNGCVNLTKVEIPDSVTTIGDMAFAGCTSLVSIDLPAAISEIQYGVFRGCTSLARITIPDTVTAIVYYSFTNCTNLSVVDVPQSVKSIGVSAFNGCNRIGDVNYGSNEEDWNSIEIDTGNASLTNANIHYQETKSISGAKLTLSKTSYTYNGNERTPTVTVVLGKETLKKGKDYTVAYSNNINAGTASVTVTGKGSYTGTATAEFTINPKSFAKAKVTLKTTTYTFDGKAKKPDVKSVVLNGKTLVKGTDYTVSYSNNKNAGTGTVTVTGKGNYRSTAKATFSIKKKQAEIKVTLQNDTFIYSGKVKTPKIKSVIVNGKTLAAAKYSVKYESGRKNVGNYKVTVTLKMDNYKGSKTIYMKIIPKGTKISSLTSITGGFKAKWVKQGVQTDGYQIQYSLDKTFKTGVKSSKVNNTKTVAKNVTGLKKGKTYYVRIRTYKTVKGKVLYSEWSAVKSIKVK